MIKTSKLLTPRILALGVLSLICLFSLTFANRASAENAALDFTIHNKTGFAITKLYLSPHTDTKTWGDDIMGADAIADGADQKIVFDPTTTTDVWDMRAEDKDGTFYEWTDGFKLSEITDITLDYDAATKVCTATHENKTP